MRRKLLGNSAAAGNDFSLFVSVVYQLRKIYGSKRPGYRLLIFDELQRLRYRSTTSSSCHRCVADRM